MWGIHGSPSSSFPYSFWIVVNGILFIWNRSQLWNGSFGRHINIAFWKAVPHCIMWCLWQEQNSRSFEGCERTILDFKAFFLCTLLDWSVAFHSPPCFSPLDILEHCNLFWLYFSLITPPVYLVWFPFSKNFRYLLKKKKLLAMYLSLSLKMYFSWDFRLRHRITM